MRVPDVSVKSRKHTDASFLELDEETKNPNLHYRWVRVDANNSSKVRHEIKGYAPVKKGEIGTMSDPETKGGDHVIVGDLMLMACPKDEYEARQQEKLRLTQERINSTTIEAERRAAEKGIKLIRDADHNKKE